MKNLKKVSCIIIFLLSLLSVGCSNNDVVNSNDVDKSSKQENISSNNSYEVESVTNTFKTKIYEEYVDLEITYPQVKGLEDKDLENTINKTIKNKFLSYNEVFAAECNVIDESLEIASKTDNILSIRYKFVNKPDDVEFHKEIDININMKNGKLIYPDNLFKSEESVEKVKSIVDEIIKNENLNVENPIGNENTYEDVYFTDKNLVIYNINDENTEIKVPLDEISDYINI
ncbi:hypothetical protein [Tepidibacter hydrothermalis]|uniref:Lipoprotein n=1 Tax=Tepidibacter hydrothermalis TaxID=3036126 RepID=A0ABY8ECB4_9FIRM|nr:hypothetical protein [Tepidibacter hydrothermalis]WFD10582.1 hypothetical protein P4S50_00480 [Tepidibacter hydrothermalis]